MSQFSMTVREGPRFSRLRTDSIDELFAAVEQRTGEVSAGAGARPVDALLRTFEPREQVVGRIEIVGRRGLVSRDRAGIDVRGDGSIEAFVGRTSREPIEPLPGESVIAALRRVFTDSDRRGGSGSQ